MSASDHRSTTGARSKRPTENVDVLVERLRDMPAKHSGQEHLEIIAALSDSRALVRIEAVEALEASGRRSSALHLRPLLIDPSALVRGAAASALGVLGGRADVALLTKRLAVERSSRARVGIAAGLWGLESTAGLVELLRLLKSRRYVVRSAVANTLAFYVERLQSVDSVCAALRAALRVEMTVAARSSIQHAVDVLQGIDKAAPSNSRT